METGNSRAPLVDSQKSELPQKPELLYLEANDAKSTRP